jgi:undecaprenyl-diphosphatase
VGQSDSLASLKWYRVWVRPTNRLVVHQFDLEILLYLNHSIEGHPSLMRLLRFLGEHQMPRLPVFGTLIWVWFSSRDIERRCRILVGLLATCFTLGVSVLCQYVLPIHIRPLLDQSIDVANLTQWDLGKLGKRIYSFPSDTAVLYFGIAYVIFAMNKIAGVANYIWCLLTVGFCRVPLGIHYPSDILAGIFFPALVVFLASRPNFLRNAMVEATKAFDGNGLITNTVFIFFMLEAYSLFPGIQSLLKVVT